MRTLTGNIKVLITAKPAFWLGALLSSAFGLLCYLVAASAVEKDAQERFNSMARSVQNTINGRVKSYKDVLRGTASLFQASTSQTHQQFQRYVAGLSLEKEFPGIDAINFARYVTDAERPTFEAGMRKEIAAMPSGYPPFRITPPGRRAGYNPITYIEPITVWSHRVGVDIIAHGSTPSNDASRDTGELAASSVPLWAVSGPNETVLSMRFPIYRIGMPVNTVEQRRAAYIGSVGVGFCLQRMLHGVLDLMPVRGVRLTLSDIDPQPDSSQPVPAGRSRLLFDSKATMAMPSPPLPGRDHSSFVTTLPVAYNMRVWEAHFSIPKAKLYTVFDAYVPWLAMLAGCVSTMLLYTMFNTLSSAHRSAVALARNMTKDLRASEAKLQLSNENLRQLGAHAENIKEDERKRIAREIHDDLGQNLLVLRIEADMLSSRTQGRHPRLHERARATVTQIDATIKSVRQIINDLRPNVLDLGLNAAVAWQIAEFRRNTGIECDLAESHQEIPVSDRCATALFRILQESLSNISRHAQATRVHVVLRVEHDGISMSVGDNGIGLDPKGRHRPGSFGLVGIEERIAILGGTFAIHSNPGSGTTIQVAVPMHDSAPPPVKLIHSNDGSTHTTQIA